MADCVTLNSDGTLTETGQDVADCTGYVLVSGSEYGVYQTVQTALGVPTVAESTGWFVGSFCMVMMCFVAGRAAGSVVAMFNGRKS